MVGTSAWKCITSSEPLSIVIMSATDRRAAYLPVTTPTDNGRRRQHAQPRKAPSTGAAGDTYRTFGSASANALAIMPRKASNVGARWWPQTSMTSRKSSIASCPQQHAATQAARVS